MSIDMPVPGKETALEKAYIMDGYFNSPLFLRWR